jgi:hypothetical protein
MESIKSPRTAPAAAGTVRQLYEIRFTSVEGQEYKLKVTKWGKISMENKTDIKTKLMMKKHQS